MHAHIPLTGALHLELTERRDDLAEGVCHSEGRLQGWGEDIQLPCAPAHVLHEWPAARRDMPREQEDEEGVLRCHTRLSMHQLAEPFIPVVWRGMREGGVQVI